MSPLHYLLFKISHVERHLVNGSLSPHMKEKRLLELYD